MLNPYARSLRITILCARCHEEKSAWEIRWLKPFDNHELPGERDSPAALVETTSDDPDAEPICLECARLASVESRSH